MTPEIQIALLRVWAKDTSHVVDPNNSPKAEFARLAKAKGWTGGSVEWCHHWTECFNETYSWGLRSKNPLCFLLYCYCDVNLNSVDVKREPLLIYVFR
jgi:hypothetical protein